MTEPMQQTVSGAGVSPAQGPAAHPRRRTDSEAMFVDAGAFPARDGGPQPAAVPPPLPWECPADAAGLWRVACHEAGHTVVALDLDHTIKRVAIFDDGRGLCSHDPPENRSYSAWEAAMIAAAGPAAEADEFAQRIRQPQRAARRPPRVPRPEAMPSDATELLRSLAVNYYRESAPDWLTIRDFAARDANYNEWASRVERIQTLVRRALTLRLPLLARTARLLYRRGVLFEDDIKRLLIPRGRKEPRR